MLVGGPQWHTHDPDHQPCKKMIAQQIAEERSVVAPKCMMWIIGGLHLPSPHGPSQVDLLESTSIARALARKNGYELNYNLEIVGLGLANFAGAAFNAYTTTGSFSRSAVNDLAGGTRCEAWWGPGVAGCRATWQQGSRMVWRAWKGVRPGVLQLGKAWWSSWPACNGLDADPYSFCRCSLQVRAPPSASSSPPGWWALCCSSSPPSSPSCLTM